MKIKSKLEKENSIAIIGMAIEYYVIFLFGYLSGVISPVFFRESSYLIRDLTIFISFVPGLLGAIICGHIGDIKGRKKILSGTWTNPVLLKKT